MVVENAKGGDKIRRRCAFTEYARRKLPHRSHGYPVNIAPRQKVGRHCSVPKGERKLIETRLQGIKK
jgi:hypothetical protein